MRSDLSCFKTLTGHTGSVLCLQYDDRVIVTGSSDSTIRFDCLSQTKLIWQKHTHKHSNLECIIELLYTHLNVMTATLPLTHCPINIVLLVFHIRVWDVSNGTMINTLVHHCEAVLHLRFNNDTMVTCSKVCPLAVV